MENCYYDSALGRNSCDEPIQIEQAPTSDFVNAWLSDISTVVFLIGFIATLVLIVISYWNGSQKTINTIFSKPIKPLLLSSLVTTVVSFILILIASQGGIADYLSVPVILTYIIFWGLAFLFTLIAYIVLAARYAMRVATRTGRSRIGFIWLSVLFPGLALIVCLILDKDENRYELDGRDTYRLPS